MMDDSRVARRTRSTSKSAAAASSPAGADRRYSDSPRRRDKLSVGSAGKKVVPDVGKSYPLQNDSDSKIGRNSPAPGIAVNEKYVLNLETPSGPQTSSGYQLFCSDSNRPPIGTVDSPSPAGSSIRSNKVFDTPASSPPYDSNSTSPKEDTISTNDNRSPVDYLRRIPPQRTDYNDQEPAGFESPMADAERRKRLFPKSRVVPTLTIPTPPATGRQRSSSAPTVTSPTKPKSSSDDSFFTNDSQLVSDLEKLSLRDKSDAVTTTRRAGSKTLEKLAAEQKGRPSSASGRVETRVTNKAETSNATKELADTSNKSMEREPTNVIPSHTAESNKCAGLEGRRKAGQPNLLAESSIADVEKPGKPNVTPKDSRVRLESNLLSGVRSTSRPNGLSLLVQQGEVKDKIENEESPNHTKSSSVDDRSSEIPQHNSGSGSYNESEASYLTDSDTVLAVNTERLIPYDNEPNSNGHSELSDRGDAERETISELTQHNVARSTADAIPEALVANREPYPAFCRYHDNKHTDSQIRAKLIQTINPKSEKDKPAPKKRDRGWIYVYTYGVESGTGSTQTYRYFKVGTSENDPTARVDVQKDCGLNIVYIDDKKQRSLKFAGFVEDLVQCELREYRRKFRCKKHRFNGIPTNHGEWYEIEEQRLLDVIEKWRSWITKNDPYTSNATLRPRWAWKLTILDQDRDGVGLDHVLQPFTFEEKLRRRWDWIAGAWDQYFDGYKDPSRAFMDLFSVTIFIWAIFVYLLGLRLGSSIFVGLSVLILNYISWR